MAVVHTQADLDAQFACMEHCLASTNPIRERPDTECANCGASNLVYNTATSGHPGSLVCESCGAIQPGNVIFENMYGKHFNTKNSNYKRIHHWHERISQLLLLETPIPDDHMLQIAEKLLDGSYNVIHKDIIREVLRPLKMQVYIEKWLQIMHRITGIAPPAPGARLVQQLDALFQEMQQPFAVTRENGRKNFPNYNYVFCRFFQKMGCEQYCMFFPLIKSAPKIKALNEHWARMTKVLNWPQVPMCYVPQFAVRLEQPALLLERIKQRCAQSALAEPCKATWRRGFQMLDLAPKVATIPLSKRSRSDLPEQELQKFGLLKRRLQRTLVVLPQ
ncbi:VLTF3 [Pleurochrysis sp. endemic virus 1a]|nr:VLTF3 [Pleurochrysis sp. endemic virus 1a]